MNMSMEELKAEIASLEARLKHLLTSKTISLFDEKDPQTGEYLREIWRLDSYGTHQRIREHESLYGIPGKRAPMGKKVKHTKTIANRLDNAQVFDMDVNRAIDEGWSLVKREVLRPLAPNPNATTYTMLYAEFEKSELVPLNNE